MQKSLLPVVAVCLTLFLGLLTLSCSKGGGPGEFLKAPPTHGTSFLLSFDPGQAGAQSNLVAALAEAERHRFAKLGVRIYWDTPASNTFRVIAAFDAVKQMERVRRLLTRPGRVEFRLVHPQSDELIAQDKGDAGYEVMSCRHFSKSGKEMASYLVTRIPEMTGDHIAITSVSYDLIGQAEVAISFDEEGTTKFAGLTGSNVGRELAIVLDGTLVSAPLIMDKITSGHVQISGHFNEGEARDWADVLDHPLPFPVKFVETKSF